MPKDVILTPEGLEKLKDELELPLHRQAPRGRRADQGGARVRRHLRELRVRRRQERAGDARGPDRPACRRSCAWRPLSRPRTSRTDVVQVGSVVHVKDEKTGKSVKYTIVGSAEANPGREQALQRVTGGTGAARPQAQRDVSVQVPRGPARKLKITKIDVGSSEPPRRAASRSRPMSWRARACRAARCPARDKLEPPARRRASIRSRTTSRASADRRGARRAHEGLARRARRPTAPTASRAGWPRAAVRARRRSSTWWIARPHPAACARGRARRGGLGAAAGPRPRRPARRRRRRIQLAPRRAVSARRRLHRCWPSRCARRPRSTTG